MKDKAKPTKRTNNILGCLWRWATCAGARHWCRWHTAGGVPIANQIVRHSFVLPLTYKCDEKQGYSGPETAQTNAYWWLLPLVLGCKCLLPTKNYIRDIIGSREDQLRKHESIWDYLLLFNLFIIYLFVIVYDIYLIPCILVVSSSSLFVFNYITEVKQQRYHCHWTVTSIYAYDCVTHWKFLDSWIEAVGILRKSSGCDV